jgi:hypothetical protein
MVFLCYQGNCVVSVIVSTYETLPAGAKIGATIVLMKVDSLIHLSTAASKLN